MSIISNLTVLLSADTSTFSPLDQRVAQCGQFVRPAASETIQEMSRELENIQGTASATSSATSRPDGLPARRKQ